MLLEQKSFDELDGHDLQALVGERQAELCTLFAEGDPLLFASCRPRRQPDD